MLRAVAVALTLAACSTAPRAPAPTCPLRACTLVRVDPAFGARELRAIHDAFEIWERSTGGVACFREHPDGPLLIVRAGREEDLAPYMARWRGRGGVRRPGLIAIVAGGLEPWRVRDVAVHELGHELGLEHSTSRRSIMHSWDGQLAGDGLLAAEDRRAFCSSHLGCCP